MLMSHIETRLEVGPAQNGVRLAPDVVHLVFDTEREGVRAHRSSLWRRTDAGWQMYFHQGTPYGGEEA